MIRSEKEKIISELSPVLSSGGYHCLDIDWNTAERTLCVFIERDDGVLVSIDDCVAVNRLLDGEQGIEKYFDTEFYLEVSSPGLEPPLRTQAHFEKHLGEQVNVKLSERTEDRLGGKGKLLAVNADGLIQLETSRGIWNFPLEKVEKAHVVYSGN
jgi:ribosome maturation factor RimP